MDARRRLMYDWLVFGRVMLLCRGLGSARLLSLFVVGVVLVILRKCYILCYLTLMPWCCRYMAQRGSSRDEALREVLGRGALAGAVAACDRTTQQSQVQNLLEIVGAYGFPESVDVLILYIAYQVGRKQIHPETGRRLVEDLGYIRERAGRLDDGGQDGGGVGQELLRRYLGAVKWSYTAITRGHRYGVCRRLRQLGPDVQQVVGAILSR